MLKDNWKKELGARGAHVKENYICGGYRMLTRRIRAPFSF
jgi:cobyric acid synthase